MSWDWDKGATFSFFADTISLIATFGPEIADVYFQSRPARTVSDIRLVFAQPGRDIVIAFDGCICDQDCQY